MHSSSNCTASHENSGNDKDNATLKDNKGGNLRNLWACEKYHKAWRGQDAVNIVNSMNQTHMSQCTFSSKTDFVDSTATEHCTQPSAPLLDIKPLSNTQPIYITNGESIQASQLGVLRNL